MGSLGFQQTTAGSQLLEIDPLTAVATPVAPSVFNFVIRGAAFLASGDLWGVDLENRALVQIGPTTGTELNRIGLKLQSVTFAPSANTDVTQRADGQVLLVSDRDFYAVDMSSGDLTLLFTDNQLEPAPGSVAPPTLVGAVVVGSSGSERVVALDSEGAFTDDLYAYDLEAGFSRTLAAADVLPQLDAGRGDLALLIQPVASGDYNQNGIVDAADYTVWRNTLGSTTDLRANGDDEGPSMGLIDAADYLVWKNNFGLAGQAAGQRQAKSRNLPACCSCCWDSQRFGSETASRGTRQGLAGSCSQPWQVRRRQRPFHPATKLLRAGRPAPPDSRVTSSRHWTVDRFGYPNRVVTKLDSTPARCTGRAAIDRGRRGHQPREKPNRSAAWVASRRPVALLASSRTGVCIQE